MKCGLDFWGLDGDFGARIVGQQRVRRGRRACDNDRLATVYRGVALRQLGWSRE